MLWWVLEGIHTLTVTWRLSSFTTLSVLSPLVPPSLPACRSVRTHLEILLLLEDPSQWPVRFYSAAYKQWAAVRTYQWLIRAFLIREIFSPQNFPNDNSHNLSRDFSLYWLLLQSEGRIWSHDFDLDQWEARIWWNNLFDFFKAGNHSTTFIKFS